jgi:hypothetical protein
MNSPDNFTELSPRVREFLGSLTEEKVEELEAAIDFSRATKTVSKFVKWCLITMVAIVVAAAAFGEAVQKIWAWIAPFTRSK